MDVIMKKPMIADDNLGTVINAEVIADDNLGTVINAEVNLSEQVVCLIWELSHILPTPCSKVVASYLVVVLPSACFQIIDTPINQLGAGF